VPALSAIVVQCGIACALAAVASNPGFLRRFSAAAGSVVATSKDRSGNNASWRR
jgi:hypothetical protein